MERKTRVGLAQVAQAAGVSNSTASRALSGHPKVSPETRRTVLATATRLGYVRNLGAAGLASTRNTAVGLLIRDAGFHFYGQVSTEIQRETDRAGLDLLITAGGDKEETQVEAVENLLGHSVGGIIVASGRVSSRAIEHSASFVPTITVALSSTHPGIDCIRIDPQSELDLARRIIDAGHRHVAITASRHPLATTLHARTATFLTEFVVAGVTTSIVTEDAAQGEAFENGLRQALDEGATAIVAGSDMIALRALELLHEWGISCPEEVSVTGFDGVGPYRSPLLGLTTVEQPVTDMAREAVSLLTARFNGGDSAERDIRIPGRIIEGRTLGQAPARPSDESGPFPGER